MGDRSIGRPLRGPARGSLWSFGCLMAWEWPGTQSTSASLAASSTVVWQWHGDGAPGAPGKRGRSL
eukprot:2194157-Alexandrium_andersonii.AAC.1